MSSKKALVLLIFIIAGLLLSSGCIFNIRPVVEAIPDQIGKEGQEFTYQVIAYDPDDGELTYSLTEKPEGMEIGSSTGLVTWTPGESQIGTFTVEVEVSNSNSFMVRRFEITIEEALLASITVSPTSKNAYVGKSTALTSVTAHYDNGNDIDLALADCVYSSSEPTIATVSTSGVVAGIAVGSTTITVSYTEGGITKTDTVSVTVEDISLASISVLPSTMSIAVGNYKNISSITAHYSDGSSTDLVLADCNYDSDDPTIATVNNGVITGVSVGSAVITVSYTEGGITKTDTISVTVENVYLTSISVQPSTMSIAVGNYQNIIFIMARYNNGSDSSIELDSAVYSSNHTNIASVNTAGKVTGESAGSAVITVSYTEGSITKTDTVGVTVLGIPQILTSIIVSPAVMEIYVGNSNTITSITANYYSGSSADLALTDCNYDSDNDSIATVSGSGVITGVSTGLATITVSYTEGGITKTDTVSVTVEEEETLLTSITVLPSSMTIRKGQSQTIDSITAHYNNTPPALIELSACDYQSSEVNVTVANGVISVSSICAATTAIITVSYTEDGVTKSDTVNVTITGGG